VIASGYFCVSIVILFDKICIFIWGWHHTQIFVGDGIVPISPSGRKKLP